MIVGDEASVRDGYPALDVTCYPGKGAGAGSDCYRESQPPAALFFHGQFNTGLWLALLSGGIRPSQFNWHIWGGSVRKRHQPEIPPVLSAAPYGAAVARATRGDLSWFANRHPRVPGELLYFPTRMDPALNTADNARAVIPDYSGGQLRGSQQ